MKRMGFTRPNSFDVMSWKFPVDGGPDVSGSNAYYTLFNHGGPHIDAPNHTGMGGGLDSIPISAFFGPLKVFDASDYKSGRTIPLSVFNGKVDAGDVVIIYTNYLPPTTEDDQPNVITLTNEAAEFLAELPVSSFGTDSFSVENLDKQRSL